MESQQFDTKLELLDDESKPNLDLLMKDDGDTDHKQDFVLNIGQTDPSNMRFDCEGTEIELNQDGNPDNQYDTQ